LTGFTSQQVTLLVAVVAAVAALLGAFINYLATGRSKYVETITRERIKWVGELRSDFASFLNEMEQARRLIHGRAKTDNWEQDLHRLRGRQQLILLKLNRRSRLDIEISSLMQRCILAAIENEGDQPIEVSKLLRIRVSDLLKEEWETAKLESSGLLQRPRIWWRRWSRWKEHRARWAKSPPKHASKDRFNAVEQRINRIVNETDTKV
jgi:hypothetical protein